MSQNLFSLDGKVVLVTGGNSGIGLGMAEALAASGANICVWGRKPEKNEKAAERLLAFGTKVQVLGCDMSDEQEVDRTFQEMLDHFGRLDACFANAGVTGMAMPFEKMTTEEWHRVLRVNLDGTFFTLRRVARQLVEQKQGGSLVVTASLSATVGQPYGEPYATSKGGLIAMVRALAVTLSGDQPSSTAIRQMKRGARWFSGGTGRFAILAIAGQASFATTLSPSTSVSKR